jgi:PEP-CTERM motif
MKLHFKHIFAAILFILGANAANAATYGITEAMDGTWTRTSADHYTYTYTGGSLISGDSSLLNVSTTASAVFSSNTFNCITCTFTSTLSGGNTIFGTLSVITAGYMPGGISTPPPGINTNLFFGDLLTITGGTGLFAGATGGGLGFGTHNIVAQNNFTTFPSSGTSTQYLSLNVVTTPVPEPETYAMMLAGLGVLSLVARRKKSA